MTKVSKKVEVQKNEETAIAAQLKLAAERKAEAERIAKEELFGEESVALDTPAAMGTAMTLIANLLYDPYEHVELYGDNAGEVSTRNSLGFWQDKALGGLLYQLHSGLEYTVNTTIPKAKAAAQVAIRSHKGDEISEVQLQRAVAWVQRLMDQHAFISECLRSGEEAYMAATGKVYEYRSRAVANRDVVETPAMEAARKLGIGVANVAPGFGSAQAQRVV